ncbi:MAG: MarC family protein [Nitrospirota bacterium]|nr:MarC family protein [Nitrospirota bacterium]
MSNLSSHSLTVFLGFFAIMNPIANTPIFIGLTGDDDLATRKQIALRSLLTAFLIVFLFCILGKVIFELFGITLPAFRITGGALIILVGFQMLHGEQSTIHNPTKEDTNNAKEAKLSIAVSPLAMPILAGPGTIATAMNYSATGNILEIAITVASFAVLCGITYLFFIFGQRLVKFIGINGINVVTRLMGLILAVIGTQMVIQGIHEAKMLF